MDQRTEEHTNIITQLLKLYVSGQGDDPKTMVVGYLSALAEFETAYVSQAATNFNTGRVTGHNNAFRPTPAQLAQEARRVRDKDLDRVNRDKSIKGTLEYNPEAHDQASKDRVSEMMNDFIMSQKPKDRPKDFKSDKATAEMRETANAWLEEKEASKKSGGYEIKSEQMAKILYELENGIGYDPTR